MPKNTQSTNKYDLNYINYWKNRYTFLPDEITTAQENYNKADAKLKNLIHEINNFENQQVNPVKADLNAIEAQINYLKLPDEIKALENQLKIIKDNLAQLKSDLKPVEEEYHFFQNQINNFEQALNLKFKQEKFKTLQEKKALIKQELENQKIKLDAQERQLQNTQNELDEVCRKERYTLSAACAFPTYPNTGYISSNGYGSSMNYDNGYRSSNSHGFGYQTQPYNHAHVSSTVWLTAINTNPFSAQKHNLEKEITALNQHIQKLRNDLSHNNIDLNFLTAEISQLENNLGKFNKEQTILAQDSNATLIDHLNQLKKDQKPSADKQKSLHADLELNYGREKNISQTLNTKKTVLKDAEKTRDPYKEIQNIQELETKWNSQTMQRLSLEEKLNHYHKEKKQLEDDVEENLDHLTKLKLQQEKLKGDVYMQSYWHDTLNLLKRLIQTANNVITEFEAAHFEEKPFIKESIPVYQSVMLTKHFLKSLDEKITQHEKNGIELPFNVVQKDYNVLCGFLWMQLGHLDKDLDKKWINAVTSILQNHLLEKSYVEQEFQEEEKNLQLISKEMAAKLAKDKERKDFNEAKDKLRSELQKIANVKEFKPLHKHGLDLLKLIEAKKLDVNSTNNLRFYTNILNTTATLALTPTNVDAQLKLGRLITENIDGKPSLFNKILGTALLFLGVAFTFGFVLGNFPIPFLAPILTPSATFFGATLLITGAALIEKGRSHGLDRAMKNVNQSACRTKFTFFSPPETNTQLPTLPNQSSGVFISPDNDGKSATQVYPSPLDETRLYPDVGNIYGHGPAF